MKKKYKPISSLSLDEIKELLKKDEDECRHMFPTIIFTKDGSYCESCLEERKLDLESKKLTK